VKRLFEAIDIDVDDRISLEEIQNYVEQTRIPIDEAVVSQMFHDAISGRSFVNAEQRM
jgi:Ca2+-binding EF-hand superfamily protein